MSQEEKASSTKKDAEPVYCNECRHSGFREQGFVATQAITCAVHPVNFMCRRAVVLQLCVNLNQDGQCEKYDALRRT